MRIFTSVFAILVLVLTSAYASGFSSISHFKHIKRDISVSCYSDFSDRQIYSRFLVPTSNKQFGSITKKYYASIESMNDDDSGQDLRWCPPKRSSLPHPSDRFRIATWNLGNLHSQNGKAIFNGSYPSEIRYDIDYRRIKCYVRMFDPDILAVQEIDGVEALRRVVDTDIYNINVSSRPKSPNLNGKQNTGFAYKKGLIVEQLEDFYDLNVTGNLRHGTLIRLKHNGLSVKLMSVHLKSGCFDDSFSGEACESLYRQIPILETWIDSAATSDEPFIILGDFNRRFNAPGDSVWTEIDDGDPPNADLTTATANKSISCRENRYTRFIDHIVFDKRAWRWVEDSSFRHQTFRQQDKAVWRKISDHCPVVVDLWIE